MKYTRNEINRAGDILISDDSDLLKRSEAINIVNDWRELHFPVLSDLDGQVSSFLQKNGINFSFSSQRIKRRPSIIEKLKNNISNKMKLGGLQDIGGIRYVFPDVNSLMSAFSELKNFVPVNFELSKINDYVQKPKDSGYRSIHFVYKYNNASDADHDGLKIELQIRTLLQHSWAMAVETASLIAMTSLKANVNDNSIWRDFFKVVSAVFAIKEQCPVNVKYQSFDHKDLCLEYNKIDCGNHLLSQLEALRVTTEHLPDSFKKNKYCILFTDFKKRRVGFRFFENDYIKACSVFNTAEQTIGEDEAVVIVSLEKMQELKEAYPSYFMDTAEFLKSLKAFIESCKVD